MVRCMQLRRGLSLIRFLVASFWLLSTYYAAAPQDAGSSTPGHLVRLGDRVIFSADDGVHGRELWSSDGTAAGTAMVGDIVTGSASFDPMDMKVAGRHVFFSAVIPPTNRYLYVSDGTLAHTRRVSSADGNPFLNPTYFVPCGDKMFFQSKYDASSSGLAVSDGTPAGSVMFHWPGGNLPIISVKGMEATENEIFCFGFEPTVGYVLLHSDGTQEGTEIIRDIAPGNDYNFDVASVMCGNTYFFSANDGEHGWELWQSDGSSNGTRMVVDLVPGTVGSGPDGMCCLDNRVLFRASIETIGTELYISDGTPEGTQLLKDIAPGQTGSDPNGFVPFNKHVFFNARDGGSGLEPWVTDGTEDGTKRIDDLYLGPISSSPYQARAAGNRIFFAATISGAGDELCVSDGTIEGTRVLTDIIPGVANSAVHQLCVVNDVVYFRAEDVEHGVELWRSDGTEKGTWLVKDIQPLLFENLSSSPSHFVASGNTVFFAANDAEHGVELWKSAGTEDSTNIVLDIVSGELNSDPYPLCSAGRHIYFTADDRVHGRELWRSDGTAEGTSMVLDIAPGIQSSAPRDPIWIEKSETLLFVAADADDNEEPWISDGTPSGTQVLKEIIAGVQGSAPAEFTAFHDLVVFSATTTIGQRSLWCTDGTNQGTRLLTPPGDSAAANPREFWEFQDRLYFLVDHGNEPQLWSTDGSAPGTFRAANAFGELDPNAFASKSQRAVLGNTLIMAHNDGIHGIELWRTDGSAAGTVFIKDIFPGRASSSPDLLTTFAGRVWFRADDGTNGSELWQTGGNPDDTSLVRDIRFGSEGGGVRSLVVCGDRLYFVSDSGTIGVSEGEELYSVPGVDGLALEVLDIAPKAASSRPLELTDVSGKLYFTADNGVNGRELWTSQATLPTTYLVKDILPRRRVPDGPRRLSVSGSR
jgi:ELWxxDGT repeat protein